MRGRRGGPDLPLAPQYAPRMRVAVIDMGTNSSAPRRGRRRREARRARPALDRVAAGAAASTRRAPSWRWRRSRTSARQSVRPRYQELGAERVVAIATSADAGGAAAGRSPASCASASLNARILGGEEEARPDLPGREPDARRTARHSWWTSAGARPSWSSGVETTCPFTPPSMPAPFATRSAT